MTKNNNAIGVFDSGVGGLTVVSCLRRFMPNEEIIYFGDTARVPYGGKTKETITRFSYEIADFLMNKNIKAIVAACNTVSVTCIDKLKERCRIPVFGVVEAGALAAASLNGAEKVGIIGTVRTVESGAHKKIINLNNPKMEVVSKACPLFVPLVEEGLLDNDIARLTIAHYLKEMRDENIDALLLACTHYPLLYGGIKSYMDGVQIIDPAEKTAEFLKAYLTGNNLLNTAYYEKEPIFYLSDNTPKFGYISSVTLGRNYKADIINIAR